MHKLVLAAMIAIAALLVVSSPASATFITINAFDSGWHRSDGLHIATNTNYIVGRLGALQYHDWFAFNLPALGPGLTIAGGVLRVDTRDYSSPDLTETYTLFDISTPVPTLVQNRAIGDAVGLAIFADLGTGTVHGSRVYSNADDNQVRDITLNAAALAYLQARLGTSAALGGAVTTLQNTTVGNEDIYGFSGNFTRQLVLDVVPVPPAIVMAGMGALTLLGYGIRRRRARAAV
jgi:hypothetical protein